MRLREITYGGPFSNKFGIRYQFEVRAWSQCLFDQDRVHARIDIWCYRIFRVTKYRLLSHSAV